MPQPEDHLFKVRLDKLNSLRARGVEPYPHKFDRTHTTAQAVALFESDGAPPAEHRAGPVSVAGRIVAVRGMGRATFMDAQDGDGRNPGALSSQSA